MIFSLSSFFSLILKKGGYFMTKREKSRVIFVCGAVTALTITCIILYTLIEDLGGSRTLLLLVGCLLVLGAILFTFFEVRRLAEVSDGYSGPSGEAADPDASRLVVVEPPTGEPYPHHESHIGSPGLDQGQLTSQLPDALPWNLRELWASRIARVKGDGPGSKEPSTTATPR
jgi:hypothetical protein